MAFTAANVNAIFHGIHGGGPHDSQWIIIMIIIYIIKTFLQLRGAGAGHLPRHLRRRPA